MSNTMTPYLAFNGQAKEALDFYASVFGGTPETTTFGQSGVTEMGPAEGIMHGQLQTDSGWYLMAADSTKPGDEVVRGGSSLTVWGDDVDLLRSQFDKLADGGNVTMPLEKQMWGDWFGGLRDKYGIDWGFNISEGGRAPEQS